MEWFENEELALIYDTIATFSAQEVEGKVVDLERLEKPEFPRAAIDKLCDLGFLWGPAPEDIGSGMNDITTVVLLSKLAETSAGFAAIVASHYAAVAAILSAPNGFEILEGLCGGNGSRGGKPPLLGVALERDIELNEGPADNRSYVAIPAPDKVEGTVLFRGRGPDAKMTIADSPGPGSDPGPGHGTNLPGCDEMPTASLSIPDAVVGDLEAIAAGDDAAAARDVLISSLKLYYSAVMQGAARSATAYALDYAEKRLQTGRAIIHHQNVRKKLLEMEIKNQSMASFLYRAASNGADDSAFNLKDMLFAFVKVESEYVVNEAIQSLGGYGYMKEYGLEKKLRDIKTLQALLSTSLTDWLGVRCA